MRAHARSRMLAFTKYQNPEFRINWHHRYICTQLDRFVRRDINRLMIFVEPQVGKSELVSRHLPAFQFGLDPDHRWLAAAYGDTFASEFNLDVQRIMESDRYKALFPRTRIAESGTEGRWVRNSSRFDIVGHRGRYYSVGVGGSMTGRTGYTLSIDDPVKNEEEARSAAYRDKQWRWLKTVARTRLKKDTFGRPPGILLTMTRWHHDDIAARIIAEMRANPQMPQWTIISLPAEREDMEDPNDPRQIGEPLWPENRNAHELVELKADARTWYSLYQQRPSPDKGKIVERTWWRYYTKLPERFDKLIQSWDLTFDVTTKGSYVVGQVWGRLGADKYLLHQYRERIGFTDQLEQVLRMTMNYAGTTAKLVEKKANGAALINVLQKKVSGLIPIEVNGSKENRAEAVAPQVKSGNVYLPDPSIASWVDDFVEEWSVFPAGKNDDQVDAASQALSYLDDAPTFDFSPLSMTGVSKWLK